MIQIRRGSTSSWASNKKPLADGQPGYDKDRKKLKIGNGKDVWNDLPDVSGMARGDIIASESEAKKKKSSALGLLLKALGINDDPVITYGVEAPNKDTVGEVYLQHYDTLPETDYIVEAGIHSGWTYQKWKSGIARCCRTFEVSTAIQTPLGGSALYQNSTDLQKVSYPFAFKDIPCECATVHSPGGVIWTAVKKQNTKSASAVYTIISPDKLSNATYRVSVQVEGFLK